MDKLKEVKKIIQMMNEGSVTTQDLQTFITATLEFVKKQKDDFLQISQDSIDEIDKIVLYIEKEHEKTLQKVDEKSSKLEQELTKQIKEVKYLLEGAKNLIPQDGRDGLNGKDGKDGSPDTPEEIVKKINTLESVIERKTIKGLDNLVDQPGLDRALGILDQRTQYLINKTVVQPNLAGYVPNTRTLTINGTTLDLSADRSWTISTGLSALSAIGSAPNANGATITGSTLNLEPADVSFGGVVTTSAQTFSGRKTFNGYITIAGGTASANTAPLKLISGTNLTTAEAGAFEYNGTSLFFTRSGTLRADILMTDIATPFNTYSASLKGATAFTTGNNNILLGNSAGSAMTTGVDNILIGRSTSTGTGGSRNIAIGTATTAGGNYNVSIGAGAGTSSINATNAVSIGNNANYFSFNPNNGIAIGAGAESGLGDNVSIGAGAVSAYQGTNNVTVGGSAGRYAASGAGNTLIGNRTGTSLTTGAYNVALGFQSGNAITTGSKNIAIGYDVDPQSNTANGQLTIQNAIFGTDNIGVGTTVSTGNIGIYVVSPLARLHLPAGATDTNTAPLKFTTGANNTTAEIGAMEYNNTPHFTNSDATRRHIVLAPNTTKVTASAPYTNDGYIIINIGGTDFKVMTTA